MLTVCLSVQVEQCNIQECPCKCKPSVKIETKQLCIDSSAVSSHDICFNDFMLLLFLCGVFEFLFAVVFMSFLASGNVGFCPILEN